MNHTIQTQHPTLLHVLILGAGGHAKVVADILLRSHEVSRQVKPVGFLDDNSGMHGYNILGLPVLGRIPDFGQVVHDAVVVAIGQNRTRQQLYDKLCRWGERCITAKHPQAVVAPDVKIGAGTVICAGVVVNPGSTIGHNVILNTGCTIDHDNHIGSHAHIAPGVHLGGDVTVGEGAFVGIGATVLPQLKVGAWSTVGAGAVVTKDVPPGTTVVGVPAQIIKEELCVP